jgi:hypothetical protein
MSNILTNSLETKSYTLFISSNDKVSGTNNNATFNINWDSFLPREYDTYKLAFSFQTGGGNYKDNTQFTCTGSWTFSGTQLTIPSGSTYTGSLKKGMFITGTIGIKPGTYITSLGTGSGQAGTYNISTNYTSSTIISGTFLVGSLVFSGCQINMDLKGRSYSYNTAVSGPSNSILGYAQRDIQTATTNSNSFSVFYLQFPPKTISRPTDNQMSISLYNLNYLGYNIPLYDTDSSGNLLTDCTPWNIILEFTPVLSSQNNYKLGETKF